MVTGTLLIEDGGVGNLVGKARIKKDSKNSQIHAISLLSSMSLCDYSGTSSNEKRSSQQTSQERASEAKRRRAGSKDFNARPQKASCEWFETLLIVVK